MIYSVHREAGALSLWCDGCGVEWSLGFAYDAAEFRRMIADYHDGRWRVDKTEGSCTHTCNEFLEFERSQ